LLWTQVMPCGWVMLIEGAVMLMLVLALPPLIAAACVLRLLQKVHPPCRSSELWFLHCLALPPLTAVARVP
jgi:hypothetical protein